MFVNTSYQKHHVNINHGLMNGGDSFADGGLIDEHKYGPVFEVGLW